MLLLQINSSFLFLGRIEPFFGNTHLSMWHYMPKIYSPKLLAITLHYHVATRCRALGTADLPGVGKVGNPLHFEANRCCHGNEILARLGGPIAYRLVVLCFCGCR